MLTDTFAPRSPPRFIMLNICATDVLWPRREHTGCAGKALSLRALQIPCELSKDINMGLSHL